MDMDITLLIIQAHLTNGIHTSPYPTQNTPQCFTYIAEFFPNNPANCSVPTPNSTIKYHKSTREVNGQTQGVISMSFNNVTDYNYYKTRITAGSWTNFTLNFLIHTIF
jgi:hypothetical protein